jgi:23S rRNA (uracil1939-C5)-methyltransferase
MEYHFVLDQTGKISLGIFGRKERTKIPINPSKLANDTLNKLATEILNELNKQNIPIEYLKTLIVRSNSKGESVAGLFVTNKEFLKNSTLTFDNLFIFYSNPLSPASVVTEIIKEPEKKYLEEKLLQTTLKFGMMSFFQINPQMFEKALVDIKNNIESGDTVIDFYSGVGSIGLSIQDKAKEVVLVEENSESVYFADLNIKSIQAKNTKSIQGDSRKLRDNIKEDSVVIFDPTRSGLHPKIIKKCLETKPKKIIYLSCNIETQSRDIQELASLYKISLFKIYNFFPKTPHMECLIILEKKDVDV